MACEKCWADAFMRFMSDPSKSQAEHYSELLAERKDNPCTIDQERGLLIREGDIVSGALFAGTFRSEMCSYCKVRPAEHSGVGGSKCTECDDMLGGDL